MNAVLRESKQAEGAHMPVNERDDQAVQIAELRADVRHIQSDTTDIKAELRTTNQRIDSLRQGTDERFEKLNQRLDERFEKVDELKDSLASAKVWALGLYIALSGSLLYVLARGFKWL
jgi:predicted RNase H-like nuclease (RuvC/YqgF family)